MSTFVQSMFMYVLYACMHIQCSNDHAASSSHLNSTVHAHIHTYIHTHSILALYRGYSLRELIIEEQNNRQEKREGRYCYSICMACCRSTDLQYSSI
jgi:hypothetical protein